MDRPALSLEEIISLIEDDILWMASAAQSFDDIAKRMPEGEERRHIEFLAARYRLIERVKRHAATGLPPSGGGATS
jgi:hypothetical protein